MAQVHIVVGSTGEYSDRSEWMVAAYNDEAKARQHAEKAKQWYQKMGCLQQRGGYQSYDGPNNPYDPNMRVDYTGTNWTVASVEMRYKLPA